LCINSQAKMSEHDHDHDDHSTTPEGEGGDTTSAGDHNNMQMWFHFGMNETLLFRFWKTAEGHPTAFALSLAFVFFLAFFYEVLKFGREKLHHWGNTRKKTEHLPTINKSTDSPSIINAQDDSRPPSIMKEILDVHHVLQTFTYVAQLLLSYCLMLVFMSFNVWFCSAIIVGAALGHLFFGWYKSGTVNSKSSTHCQWDENIYIIFLGIYSTS